MGKIVFAAAMSHVLDPDYYQAACGLSGRRKVEACMAEIGKLGDTLLAHRPDALIVVADDHLNAFSFNVAVRYPLLGIDHLPVLVLVRGACLDVGVLSYHPAPLIGIEVLEGEPLAVRAVGQDDGMLAVTDRPVDVSAQDEAVVHRDGNVPVDAHSVTRRRIAHVGSSPGPDSPSPRVRVPPAAARPPAPPPGVRPAGAIVPCASSLAEAGVSSENSERWAGQRRSEERRVGEGGRGRVRPWGDRESEVWDEGGGSGIREQP